jgi:hypothetical protein
MPSRTDAPGLTNDWQTNAHRFTSERVISNSAISGNATSGNATSNGDGLVSRLAGDGGRLQHRDSSSGDVG